MVEGTTEIFQILDQYKVESRNQPGRIGESFAMNIEVNLQPVKSEKDEKKGAQNPPSFLAERAYDPSC